VPALNVSCLFLGFAGVPRYLHSFPTRRSSDLVPEVLRAFGPDLIFTQNGCDAHELDPLGHLKLTTHVYEHVPRRIHELVDVGRRSEEHTSELQSRSDLVCRLLLEKKNKTQAHN